MKHMDVCILLLDVVVVVLYCKHNTVPSGTHMVPGAHDLGMYTVHTLYVHLW